MARRGMGQVHPNPPVGALVVREGRLVGEGWHRDYGGDHAEAAALKQAGSLAQGAEMFVTLEPCTHQGKTPPCTRAILEAGIQRVIICRRDVNPESGRGAEFLREQGVQVEFGFGNRQAAHLLAGFESWVARKRPRVALKLAASLDGRIASASGDSRWISSPESRAWVHRRRREADAVLVGAGTAIKDNPRLTVRAVSGKSPDRVVLDSLLKVPPTHRVWKEDGSARWVFTTELSAPEDRGALLDVGVRVEIVGSDEEGRVSLSEVLAKLGENGYTNVFCEGGGTLSGAMLRDKLADVVWLMTAPRLVLGSGGPSWTDGLHSSRVARGLKLSRTEMRRLGTDWLITAVPEYAQWFDPQTAGPARFAPEPRRSSGETHV